MTPLLSVLVDTYNHESYIEQAVSSAIEQDFPASDYEIVVVDDGSTDGTAEIVRKFAPRVRLLRKKNGGQASAFNAAIPELRGELVAFLDGDDWFAPGKLRAVMRAFEQHPEAAAVGHGRYDFDEETQRATPSDPPHSKFMHLANPEAARAAMRDWEVVLMGSLSARKSMLDRITPIPEFLTFCADAPISWGCVSGGLVVLPEPLFYYRHHPLNLYSPARADQGQLLRRYAMAEAGFESTESLLIRLGVPRDSAEALIVPMWIQQSRLGLSQLGGKRLKTFRTEMREFRLEHPTASAIRSAFKYTTLGAASFLVPPRAFYKIRSWRLLPRLWYWLLGLTYKPRHAIGLNRRRTAG